MPVERHSLPPGASINFTVIEGPGQGARYTVKVLPSYIGSAGEMDIILPGRGVAGAHARLTLAEGGVFLEDLGKGSITRVNDLSTRRMRLQNGDIVEIGEVKLLAQISVPGGLNLSETDSVLGQERHEIWVAGFTEEIREWFAREEGPRQGIEARCFRTGEEVLTAMSAAFHRGFAPALLILDLRLPIINGINVAVATRAFEEGYNRAERMPLVFLFLPPESSNFEKVVEFCQPVQVVPPGEDDTVLQHRLTKLVVRALSSR